jgi:hypothetical protein
MMTPAVPAAAGVDEPSLTAPARTGLLKQQQEQIITANQQELPIHNIISSRAVIDAGIVFADTVRVYS